MPTREQLERALINADRAGAADDARELAKAIRALDAGAPQDSQKKGGFRGKGNSSQAETPQTRSAANQRRGRELLNTTMPQGNMLRMPIVGPLATGIAQGLEDIGQGAVDLAGRAIGGQTGNAMSQWANRERKDASDYYAPSRAKSETAFQTGRFVGQVVPTLPIGGGMAKGVQAAGGVVAKVAPKLAPKIAPAVEATATALRTGGFQGSPAITAARAAGAPVAKTAQLANYALRGGAGAVTGAATSALINPDDAASGAAIGALIPTVGGQLGSGVATVVKRFADGLTGQYGINRAKDIFKEALGVDYDRAMAALANASDDVTAAQALQEAGIDATTFQAIAKRVESGPEYYAKYGAQKTARENKLAELAGGDNLTDAAATRAANKNALNELTAPQRNENLALANAAGEAQNRLAPQIEQFERGAAQSVDDVRRMSAAKDRFGNLRIQTPQPRQEPPFRAQFQKPAVGPTVPAPLDVERMGVLAQKADEVATQAAERSLLFGDAARTMQSRLDDLARNGLKPLDTNRITRKLRENATRPGDRADPLRVEAMNDVAAMIDNLKQINGGVMDARDLYELRKTAINDRLTQLVSSRGFDESVSKQRVAQLLQPMRKLIDEAIEEAGGTEWTKYLNTYSAGMVDIERKKLVAEAADLMKTSPNDFVRLMAGDNPKMVEKVFGPGQNNIRDIMKPEQFAALQKSAMEIVRDQKMKELAEFGAQDAVDILAKNRNWLRIPNTFNAKVTIANAAFAALDKLKLQPATDAALRKGFLSGKSALALMSDVPAAEMNKALEWLGNPNFWTKATIAGVADARRNDSPASKNGLATLPP